MPPLTKDTWITIRAEWETGESPNSLGKKHGCSGRAINMRAKSEGWQRSVEVLNEVKRRVKEAATKSPPRDPERLEEAIEAKVDATMEVIKRHRDEAQVVRGLMYAGAKEHKQAKTMAERQLAFETLKAAKITSETIRNLQAAERKAWGLDEGKDDDTKDIIIERSYGL